MEANNKPVVLIVENGFAFTGAFKAALQVVEDLQGDFNFIFVIPRKSKQASILEEKGINYYSLPFVELRFKARNIILYLPMLIMNSISLMQIIRRERVKLIHANDLYNLAVLLPKIIYPKLKLITYVRLLPGYIPTYVYKWMLLLHAKTADALVAVSKAVEKAVNIPKALVLYDRPPNKEFFPVRYNLVNKDGFISLIYLGNYIEGKGQNYAVEAFIEAIKEIDNLCMVMVGSEMGIDKNKHYKEKLKERIAKVGLSKKVIFKDFIQSPEEELKKHQILLNFSDSESFSFTCLEASYYGLPVIATDSGGPSEIVEHNATGVIVKKGDIKEMTKAIVLLAKDEQKRIQFGERARQLVRDKFSYGQTSGQVYQLYTKLLAKSN